MPFRFVSPRAQTNKRTNEESSSRKNLGGKKKTKRCLVSHLFTRDGEHDRADAGRTSQAHSEEYYSLSRVMCLLPPGERKKCEVWCACFITKTEVFFFLICALKKIVIFGRECSLSTFSRFTFVFTLLIIRFFVNTLLLLLLRYVPLFFFSLYATLQNTLERCDVRVFDALRRRGNRDVLCACFTALPRGTTLCRGKRRARARFCVEI